MNIESIAQWISEKYSDAEKIVEVGIGNLHCVMKTLEDILPETKLVATDINKIHLPKQIDFHVDDITKPKKGLYENADLIYSIRCPPELYPYLEKLAKEMKSDLLIKPLSSEEAPERGKIVNYEEIKFYIQKF